MFRCVCRDLEDLVYRNQNCLERRHQNHRAHIVPDLDFVLHFRDDFEQVHVWVGVSFVEL